MHAPLTWRNGPVHSAPNVGLHEAFAEMAASRPDRIAIRSSTVSLTYAQLDARANACAEALQRQGVEHGSVVAILLPRSVELVVALLGVLKCGAAYAAPDPSWPDGRIEEALAVMAARHVISRRGLSAHATWFIEDAPTTPGPGFRHAHTNGDEAAAVLFTSGTSGGPKCVRTTHRAMLRLCRDNSLFRMEVPRTVPLAAPPAWDMFGLELWGALLSGGTSVVVSDPFLSAAALREGVARHGVDAVWLTTSLFNLLVDDDIDSFDGLAEVVIGGERVSPSHIRTFLGRHAGVRLVNGYGPVESVVLATSRVVQPADCERPDGVPIGLPLPGTSIHVLAGERPCTLGEMGEICIAGDGLALEYMGDPERTSRAFPTLVLDGVPTRVYRTGDLGAWGADGLLVYGGRADRQLKVRGNRVEPAEVEAQVEQEDDVQICRVVAQCDDTGAVVALAAFCVPRVAGDPLTGLSERLAARLSAQHLPRTVAVVPKLPLTERGKVDDRALLALLDEAPKRPRPTGLPVAAGGEDASIRDVVWECFAAVLGRDDLDPTLSLFALGGTSLDAGRLCARLSNRLGRPVPLSSIYASPGIDALAAELASLPDERTDVDDWLSPMQVAFLTSHLADPTDTSNACLMVWHVTGTPDADRLRSAVAAVHERHEALGSIYTLDPFPMALPLGSEPPEVHVLPAASSMADGEVALTTALSQGLDPLTARLWRVAMVSIGSDTLLGCSVHHIAFDGASESILARDLAAAYGGRLDGPTTPVPVRRPKGSADVSRTSATLNEFEGVPPIAWPEGVGSPGGPLGHVSVRLGPDLVAALATRVGEGGATRFVVLFAAWADALTRVTGVRDVAVGVPVSQRTHRSQHDEVGCHMTTVPLRLNGRALAGDLEAVGEVVRAGLARQDVPLTTLLASSAGHGGRPPLFQTLFGVQDNPPPLLELDGHPTRFLRQPYPDLTLELHAEVWVEGEELELVVSHRTDAVPEEAARALVAQFPQSLATVIQGQVSVPV